jgi:hypothetical protein
MRAAAMERSRTMQRFRFPIAVALTSLALVLALGVIGALTVGTALANSPLFGAAAGMVGSSWGPPWAGGQGWGKPGGGGHGITLPAEVQGLGTIPPAERFDHFLGVQVDLKDKDNKPLTVAATPGSVTAASATSLTLAANDGTTKSYTLNGQTIVRGKPASGDANATVTPASGDKVVVVTLNNSTTATAVMIVPADGLGPRGPRGGPFGR